MNSLAMDGLIFSLIIFLGVVHKEEADGHVLTSGQRDGVSR